MKNPEITLLKTELDSILTCVQDFKATEHSHIKILSLLNVTIYVKATRFIEASVKSILYNCCVFKGLSKEELKQISNKLKNFNNPEFTNIKDIFLEFLTYDITEDINKFYTNKDISFLNEIVRNRHRNVHATELSMDWFNSNMKDLNDFIKEYDGIINIIDYLQKIKWDSNNMQFIIE